MGSRNDVRNRRAVGTQYGKLGKFIYNYLISQKIIKFTMRGECGYKIAFLLMELKIN